MKLSLSRTEVEAILLDHVKRNFNSDFDEVEISTYSSEFCSFTASQKIKYDPIDKDQQIT